MQAGDPGSDVARITLNGEPLFFIVEASEEEGWADVLARDSDGKFYEDANHEKAVLERRWGAVKITIDTPA
jgi:hypothetical protein